MFNKLLSRAIGIIICCVLISFSVSALDGNSMLAGSTAKETVNSINYDFIPHSLLTDTQRNITREEYCATIVNLYEFMTKDTAQLPDVNPFSDTDNYAVLKAYNLGIVNGIGEGKFDPKQSLTIEQEAKMLYFTLIKVEPSINDSAINKSEFKDADKISSWAVKAIEYLYNNGIITADNNLINPQSTVTVEKANNGAQNTFILYKNILSGQILGNTPPLITSAAYSTLIAVPGNAYKNINDLKTGDEVITADMSLKWSASKLEFSSGTGPSSKSNMAYIKYGDNKCIIVSTNQLLMLSDKKFKKAVNIVPGKDCLIDKDGNPVNIISISVGMYLGGINGISTNNSFSGTPDGHLLLANGIVIGDFTLEINYDKLDKYVDDAHSNPQIVN